ncbi:MAG: glycosyltransferase family 9 protein, partial [Nitrospinota bacterium]
AAAAQGVPTVTVAGPTRVSATRPWGGRSRVVQTRERLPCMPCYGTPLYGNCPFGVKCMKQVTEQQILAELAPYFRG